MKIDPNLQNKSEGNFSNTFLRLILIGSTLFSNKLILIFIAYFLTEVQYNLFNKAYYTASILILFGTLGFEFAVNRISVSLKTVCIAVLANVAAAMMILNFTSEPFENVYQIASIFTYSLFASLGGIFTFQHLFQGRVKTYVVLMIINALLHLSIIPFITSLKADIFFLFPFITLIWFLIGFPGFIKHITSKEVQFKELYKLGVSTFIINSAVSLALVIDKYLVNHNFPMATANAYTFAWGLIVPLLYIGNVVEKLIYSSTSKDEKRVFRKSMLLLLLLVGAYSIMIFSIVNFIPSLMPNSVDHVLLKQILNFMILGYALFAVFNFPVNGFLFKFAETYKQKRIAIAYLAAIILFPLLFIIYNGGTIINNYQTLLIGIWMFIFLLLIIKTVFIFLPSERSLAA